MQKSLQCKSDDRRPLRFFFGKILLPSVVAFLERPKYLAVRSIGPGPSLSLSGIYSTGLLHVHRQATKPAIRALAVAALSAPNPNEGCSGQYRCKTLNRSMTSGSSRKLEQHFNRCFASGDTIPMPSIYFVDLKIRHHCLAIPNQPIVTNSRENTPLHMFISKYGTPKEAAAE
jgi:hypothetical protein